MLCWKNIFTIDRITTHGKFRALTMRTAREVFPEPLEPAIPIIYSLLQYWLANVYIYIFRPRKCLRKTLYTHEYLPMEGYNERP